MKKGLIKGSLFFMMALFTTGCGSEGACCEDGVKTLTQITPKTDIVEKSITTDIPNLPKIEPKSVETAPIAVALVNNNAKVTYINSCQSVVYDAAGSYDTDGNSEVLTYQWLNSDGDLLSHKESFKKKYSKKGFYETTLEVTDEQNLTATDRVCVLVGIQESDINLKASAGRDTSVLENQLVKISGHGICKEADDIARYSWKENGSVISEDSDFEASFTEGMHILTLTIVDLEGNSAMDSVVINVTK